MTPVPGLTHCWWIVCPSGPHAIGTDVAAARLDAARPTFCGTAAEAMAVCDAMAAEWTELPTTPAKSPRPRRPRPVHPAQQSLFAASSGVA